MSPTNEQSCACSSSCPGCCRAGRVAVVETAPSLYSRRPASGCTRTPSIDRHSRDGAATAVGRVPGPQASATACCSAACTTRPARVVAARAKFGQTCTRRSLARRATASSKESAVAPSRAKTSSSPALVLPAQ